jgi:hypothetical protein
MISSPERNGCLISGNAAQAASVEKRNGAKQFFVSALLETMIGKFHAAISALNGKRNANRGR